MGRIIIIKRSFSHSASFMKHCGSSSRRWMQRQMKDPFVKRAQENNYRCRSAFKLLQIDDNFNLLRPGHTVIDCGASPGSWTQVAVERVNANASDPSKRQGFVIGIDLQDISPIEGATVLPLCDFTQTETQDRVRTLMKNKKADIVLSDMAPSATGVQMHNHGAIIDLCFSVLRFSLGILRTDGNLLCKIWMGAHQKRLENAMKSVFDQVHTVKPTASRDDSAEIFILAKGFSGLK